MNYAATTKQTIGGHIALDLLNTVPIVNGQLVDEFQTDKDVLQWLADYDLASELALRPNELMNAARELRESIRKLIAAKKDRRQLDLDVLNRFLVSGISHMELVTTDKVHVQLERRRKIESVHQLLAPVAEAAAELLAMDDFTNIRRCESPECVLWFYDRTKGHKRRWCSMSICGNRHKVSSFRKRQNA